MTMDELVRKSRSYRRFDESREISADTVRSLIELARFAPSGANRQPVKFMIATTPEEREAVFPHLAWAGYLESWKGPLEGERPTAYAVLLLDTEIASEAGVDHGIFAQTILLGAAERGIGGCMIGAIRREDLRAACTIPGRFEILLVVALGYPAETVVIEDAGAERGIRYYRDADDTHHVPKRPLEELIVSFR